MVKSDFLGSCDNPMDYELHETLCGSTYFNWSDGELSECGECRAVVIDPLYWEDEAELE